MKTMILCAPGLEECEALIVYDLLFRAGIDVKLVGLAKEITSSHKVTFLTDLLIDEVKPEEYNCLILPGGIPGTPNLEKDERVQKLIDLFIEEEKLVCAICAAPGILIRKGLLKDGCFTCFPGKEEDLTPANKKAVQDGRIITGKGMGAAVEFAYMIIENLVSKEKADEVIERICY